MYETIFCWVWPYSIYEMWAMCHYTRSYMGHTGEGVSTVRQRLTGNVAVFLVAVGFSSAGGSLEGFLLCKR
jgi:hypothetical protein